MCIFIRLIEKILSDLEDPALAKPRQKLESSLILMRVIPGTSIVGSFTLSKRANCEIHNQR